MKMCVYLLTTRVQATHHTGALTLLWHRCFCPAAHDSISPLSKSVVRVCSLPPPLAGFCKSCTCSSRVCETHTESYTKTINK